VAISARTLDTHSSATVPSLLDVAGGIKDDFVFMANGNASLTVRDDKVGDKAPSMNVRVELDVKVGAAALPAPETVVDPEWSGHSTGMNAAAGHVIPPLMVSHAPRSACNADRSGRSKDGERIYASSCVPARAKMA
jgi:hypothetical protein